LTQPGNLLLQPARLMALLASAQVTHLVRAHTHTHVL
jgi:hypothetical protein